MKPEELTKTPVNKSITDAVLLALEHDEEFLREFASILIHKIRYGCGDWVEQLKDVLK